MFYVLDENVSTDLYILTRHTPTVKTGWLIYQEDSIWNKFLAYDPVDNNWVWKKWSYEDPNFIHFQTKESAEQFYNAIKRKWDFQKQVDQQVLDKSVSAILRKATLEIKKVNHVTSQEQFMDHSPVQVFGTDEERLSRLVSH